MSYNTAFVMIPERTMRMVDSPPPGPPNRKHSEWFDCENWINVNFVAQVRNAENRQTKDDGCRCEVVLEIGDEPCSVFTSATVAEVMARMIAATAAQDEPIVFSDYISSPPGLVGRERRIPRGGSLGAEDTFASPSYGEPPVRPEGRSIPTPEGKAQGFACTCGNAYVVPAGPGCPNPELHPTEENIKP